MAEPDFTKLRDVCKRLKTASESPDYGMEQFEALANEAEEAVGDNREYLECLLKYDPRERRKS